MSPLPNQLNNKFQITKLLLDGDIELAKPSDFILINFNEDGGQQKWANMNN